MSYVALNGLGDAAADMASAIPALRYFAEYNSTNSSSPKSGDEFVAYVDAIHPTFRKHFGGSVRIASLSESQLRSAMENAANIYKGKWPDARGLNALSEALIGEVTSYSYAFSDAAAGIKEDVTEIVETVAPQAMFIFKYFPIILGVAALGALALFTVRSSDKLSGAVSDRLKAKNPRRRRKK